MRKILCLIALFFYLYLFPSRVSASGDVVINEFLVEPDSGQWVELYNSGGVPIDISGWFIDDNGGTQKFTIPLGTNISPGEFKIFESSSFNLNVASDDEIRLLNNSVIIDSYSYNKSPGSGFSFGRDKDGEGNWVVFNSPTKGLTNNSATPVPTATLTPTNTPTPTNSPTPTKVPTPTKTPTPAPSKTPTPIPLRPIESGFEGQAKTPTPIPKNKITSTGAMPTSVLGVKVSATPTPKSEVLVDSAQSNNIFKVFAIIIGSICIFVSIIYIFLKTKKNEQENTN